MLLLTFREIYRRKVAEFKESLKDTLDTFGSITPIFSGFKKVFGVTIFNTQYPIYNQQRPVKQRVSVMLDEFIEEFSQVLDADLQYNAAIAENTASYDLKVGGFEFGSFTLLQLKSLYKMLELKEVSQVYGSIPVRKPEGKWEPSTEDGVYINRGTDFINHIHFFPERGASLTFPGIHAIGALEGAELSDFQLLEFEMSSSALSPDVLSAIRKRREDIRTAIVVLIDSASAHEVNPIPKAGAKILNYIHYGDTQGVQGIPY